MLNLLSFRKLATQILRIHACDFACSNFQPDRSLLELDNPGKLTARTCNLFLAHRGRITILSTKDVMFHTVNFADLSPL